MGGLVLRGHIPHKFALQMQSAFVLADAAVRLEVVGQTFISELRPARTVLDIVKYFFVEESRTNGARSVSTFFD